ncbi:FMN-binding protein [Trichlorobacter lovleyi]|uniref:FMN-binding protein n=1 Tax=Trichlorobacter lovleyi TaxID=313985 RepID=UPI003D11692C
MEKLNRLVTIVAIVVALMSYVFYFFDPASKIDESFIKKFEEISSYRKINTDPIVYEVVLGNGEPGYVVFSSEYGYQSEIILAILINKTGQIVNVKTYSERETRGFYQRLYNNGFFEKNFHGLAINNGFSIHTNVDAVSGATISSGAVSKAIHEGSAFVGKKYLDIDVVNPYGSIRFGILEIAIITMFIFVLIAYLTKNKHLRTLTLVYSFTLMGIKFMAFISYSTFISFITFNFPSVFENLSWYLLFFGSVALVMSTGKNLYCAYICPFGAMQQMVFQFAKLPSFKVSENIQKYIKVLPVFIAWFAFVVTMLSKDISAVNYEPFALIFGRTGLGIQWILLPITVFMSFVIMRYYCRYGCPVGLIWNILLKVRWKVKSLVWTK